MSQSIAVCAGVFMREWMYPGSLPLSVLVFSATMSIAGVAPDSGTGHLGGSDQGDVRRLHEVENWREQDHPSSGWELPLRDTGEVMRRGRLEEGTYGCCCMHGNFVCSNLVDDQCVNGN